jgi:hypothetical protein
MRHLLMLVACANLALHEGVSAADRPRSSSDNMQQLVGACVAWMFDSKSAVYPKDLQTVLLVERCPASLLVCPGAETVPPPHYLYVRPTVDPTSAQIVIVENPACRNDGKILVCYGDCHAALLAGDAKALWKQANDLAISPEAKGDGVRLESWVIPK